MVQLISLSLQNKTFIFLNFGKHEQYVPFSDILETK